MSLLSSILIDFDSRKNIIHVSYKEEINILTEDDLYSKFNYLEEYIKALGADRRYYLVVDMSNLIINPSLVHQYAMESSRISNTYFHEDGVARYGFQMSRIVVKRAHRENLNGHPRIFSSKKDAFDYIESLIKLECQPD